MSGIRRIINKDEKGFTLIELMIVVAILGILAAIAIPNFMRFQAKSRQSESKTNLGSIGTAVESWRAENGTYILNGTTQTINSLGWAPQGTTRYSYWYNENGTPTMFPYPAASFSTGVVAVVGGCDRSSAPGTSAVTAAAATFSAGAKGEIDSDATCDEWSYTNLRVLTNDVNDVSS